MGEASALRLVAPKSVLHAGVKVISADLRDEPNRTAARQQRTREEVQFRFAVTRSRSARASYQLSALSNGCVTFEDVLTRLCDFLTADS